MPSKGYATIGLKPAILARLEEITDQRYPGMFIPSALIIMMNEVKRGYYSVGLHNIKEDFGGRYTSLTIRSDVKYWLDENYQKYKEDYYNKYRASSYTQFASYFMLNIFESKNESQNYVIKIKEADFKWLHDEYQKRKQEYRTKYSVCSYEQFADIFLKQLFDRVAQAKEVLTL